MNAVAGLYRLSHPDAYTPEHRGYDYRVVDTRQQGSKTLAFIIPIRRSDGKCSTMGQIARLCCWVDLNKSLTQI